jgi:hypothetical protein
MGIKIELLENRSIEIMCEEQKGKMNRAGKLSET